MAIEYKHDHAVVTSDEFPNMRFIVHPDTDASDPSEYYGDGVELYVFAAGYNSCNDTPAGYWSEIFAQFYTDHDNVKALDMVRRFAIIFHGWTREQAENRIMTLSTPGNSPGDWADIFVAVPDENYGCPGSYAEEWSQWANGNVYGVCPERYVPCEHPETCHGDDDDHWTATNDQGVEFDNLWGIYADDVEDAAKYFAENYM